MNFLQTSQILRIFKRLCRNGAQNTYDYYFYLDVGERNHPKCYNMYFHFHHLLQFKLIISLHICSLSVFKRCICIWVARCRENNSCKEWLKTCWTLIVTVGIHFIFERIQMVSLAGYGLYTNTIIKK